MLEAVSSLHLASPPDKFLEWMFALRLPWQSGDCGAIGLAYELL